MSEFESEASLDIVVEQQSLRTARQQVEQEFTQTPITVDVQTDANRSSQARQTSSPDNTRAESREMAARDRARTRQLLTDQTAVLEDIAAQVETLAPEESQDPLDLAEPTPDPVEEPDPAESEPPGDLALSLPSGSSPEFPEQPPQQTDGGRNEGRRRRRERRQYRWDRQRTESLEAAVELLAGLEGDDGGGAGGILDELLGVGAGAGAGLLSGAIGPALGSGIGSAVGTAVGDVLSDEEVALNTEDVEEIGVDVPDDPLAVDHPEDPYAVDHPEDPYAIDHPDDPYAVDHPEDPYDVDHPEEPYALDHPDEPYAVEDPSPLEVEDVDPIEVEAVDPIEISVSGGRSGGDLDTSSDEDVSVFDLAETFIRELPGGETAAVAGEGVGTKPRTTRSTATDPAPGLPDDWQPPDGGATGTNVTVEPQQDVTVNLGDVSVDTDLDSFRDDILDETERMIDDAIRDLERQLSQ
ncbi:hypothetical protein [Halosolutus halophilus]|uniref:hypothetical protein n=1 Tax=Halosolutus halophilus TaxID=1552990 RepID=UPI0022351989|nr:hypothetical protein [Halosolutus halophilus]